MAASPATASCAISGTLARILVQAHARYDQSRLLAIELHQCLTDWQPLVIDFASCGRWWASLPDLLSVLRSIPKLQTHVSHVSLVASPSLSVLILLSVVPFLQNYHQYARHGFGSIVLRYNKQISTFARSICPKVTHFPSTYERAEQH